MKKRKKREELRAAPSSRSKSAPPFALVCCVCVLLALALYWGALRNPLVFDDHHLRDDFLRFFGASWFQFDFRWLPNATFGWIYDLVGKQWAWHRAFNVLLHAATAVLLFSFLARLFELVLAGPPAIGGQGSLSPRWIAFFGALLFLLHPVAVYGVAYLIQRSIVLATLFCLLSLRLFLEGLAGRSRAFYLAAAGAYFLAALSKEHSVMLPAVAAALAVLVRGYSAGLLRELALPATAFIAIGLLIILKASGFIAAPYETFAGQIMLQSPESRQDFDAENVYPLSVINQGLLFFRYLLVWCIPYTGWMSVDLRPSFPAQFLSWPHTVGFVAYLAYPALAVALLWRRGRTGLLGFGLLFPWLLALTEVATVRIQEPLVLYRSYLWMGGLTAALPAALWRLPAKWSYTVLGAACVVLILPLQDRLDSFSSAAKLWDDVVRKNTNESAPLVERGHLNRGLAFLQSRQHAEALRDFNKAIELNPRSPDAHLSRGTLYTRTGRHVEAFSDLDRAIELDPRYAEAYAKRCFVRMMLDNPRDALADCRRAVVLDPRHRDARTNLGVVYAALNRTAEAEASYRRALDIDSSNADANYNYGVLLAVLGRRDEASRHLAIGCDARIADACKLLSSLRRK